MKRFFVLPLVLVFALLVAVPVSAAPPVVVTGEFEDDYVPFDPSPCPGIEVRDHEVVAYRWTSYFDNQGNLLRTQYHVVGTDSFYNPANPGVVLSGHFVHNIEINELTGEVSHSGIPAHITYPGYGTVLVLAGRWSPEFPNDHVAGKDSFADPTDMEQFCSLLVGD